MDGADGEEADAEAPQQRGREHRHPVNVFNPAVKMADWLCVCVCVLANLRSGQPSSVAVTSS